MPHFIRRLQWQTDQRESAGRLRDFYERVSRLKTLERAGWQRCGVEACESVAEHSFGVGVLALVLGRQAGVDGAKCVELALVHDLAEAIVGDLTPADGVEPVEKARREREAIKRIARELGDPRIIELWEEFEAAATPEAMLVRDLDVIEMAWQARAYENEKRLSTAAAREFVESAYARVRTEMGKKLLGERGQVCKGIVN